MASSLFIPSYLVLTHHAVARDVIRQARLHLDLLGCLSWQLSIHRVLRYAFQLRVRIGAPNTSLPLRLLPPHKLPHHNHPLLQRAHPLLHLLPHLPLILTPRHLGIEIPLIRRRRHSRTEHGLHQEGVVRFQRRRVRRAERIGELGCRVRERVPQGRGGEIKPPYQPEEPFRGGVLFGGEFIRDEGLQGGGLGWGGKVQGADFGDVAEHIVFHRGEGDGAEEVCDGI